MYNTIISSLDIISFLIIFLTVCLVLHNSLKLKEIRNSILIFLLIFELFYLSFMIIEWLGISNRFEMFENYTGATLPLWWLFLFYSLTQTILMKDIADREELFNQALDVTQDGLWDWDILTGDVFYSSQWFSMLGYKIGDFPNSYSTWRNLIHPDDLTEIETEVLRHFELNECFEIEVRMRSKSKKWIWIMSRGKVVKRDSSGNPERMVGTHIDISSRKIKEAEIKKLQSYLSSIINSMPSILIGIDLDYKITFWNSEAELATGFDSKTVTGYPLTVFFPRLEQEMNIIRQAIDTGKTQTVYNIIRESKNKKLYDNIYVFPVKTKDLSGIIIRIDDVTEKNNMEELIVQSDKMLSLGGVAAGMAHEINNPLSAIIGYAQNINRRLFEPLQKNKSTAKELAIPFKSISRYAKKRGIDSMLDKIAESGERSSKLVRNMLNFSRKSSQEISIVNIKDLLQETLDLVLNTSDWNDKKIRNIDIDIAHEYQKNIPDISCDRNMIQQVLFNIFQNDIEAMDEKKYLTEKPCIKIRLYTEQDNLIIEIEDNGPGMDKEIQSQIFNAFFTTKEIGKGTGLGLSISYFIITELHNGIMEVHSSVENFTCFTIKLPIKADHQ
ncbi:PAS domain-containing protein [Desulfovibrio sp. UCD-KL4C]|uniref:PAS domain-containing sensor histidine kinase n=1 Tax=Desulfovibrio sp. UCD-KL4C TaxID=2578120 RepID=UPI0025C23947|nr:PAS domain-containing protein [Desulfovibrio sp. UCD-KL4C]